MRMVRCDAIKAAIVGCGLISQTYLDCFKSRLSIIDIQTCCDLDACRARTCAERNGLKVSSWSGILEAPLIEMVINLTNPSAHHTISRQAMLSGKHVYSEKPIASSLEEAKDLVMVSKETGMRMGVAPDTFLGAGIQTAKYIVDQGLIGKPLSFAVSLTRDYGIYGDILPHLNKTGGGIALDMGGYYLTALASILGPFGSIMAFTRCNEPSRRNMRLSSPEFGRQYSICVPNILSAAISFRNGVLGTLHMNADTILDETRSCQIFGTEGIIGIDDPNQFGSRITLKKMLGSTIEFPFTHGYAGAHRGIGAAEMAWSIRTGRIHRTSMELAYHVFEALNGITISAETGLPYMVESTMTIPESLPAGYIDHGEWGPTEESSLAF
jgi:predicted dehydrogenase